jgi:carboxylesterase type B
MLFGNSGDVSGTGPGEEQEKLTRWMQGAWVAFARDPAGGLEELGWPKWKEGEQTVARLGYGNGGGVDFVRPEVYSLSCSSVVLAGGQ